MATYRLRLNLATGPKKHVGLTARGQRAFKSVLTRTRTQKAASKPRGASRRK